MNLLQKKIEHKSDPSQGLNDPGKAWLPLQLAICSAFGEMTSESWEIEKVDLKSAGWKELRKELPLNGLFYGYGTSDGPSVVLTNFSTSFAQSVAQKSLKTKFEINDAVYLPNTLDLILFKPISKTFELEFSAATASITSDKDDHMKNLEQGTSPADIELEKGTGLWTKVTFLLRQAEEEFPSVSKKKPAKKPKKKSAEPSVSVQFEILLPQQMMQSIVSSNSTSPASNIIDLDNPWSHHMRRSVDTANVPIRAVVETCRMTVADCTRFKIDQVIELPGVSLQAIGLETEIAGGQHNIVSGALGIYKSHRAVKLSEDISADFCFDTAQHTISV